MFLEEHLYKVHVSHFNKNIILYWDTVIRRRRRPDVERKLAVSNPWFAMMRPSGLLNQEVCMAENLENYFEQNRVMFI